MDGSPKKVRPVRPKPRDPEPTPEDPTPPDPVSDTTPNAFSFTPVIDAELSTVTTSNSVTVSGIDATVSFSVTGGEAQKNGAGDWLTSGTVVSGDTLRVRVTSSGSNSTAVEAVLTVGGVSGTFSVTTEAASPPVGTLVTTQAEFLAALANEAGGYTVRVGPGNYPYTVVRDKTYASPVNIVAGDESDPPVFAGLWFYTSSNITFDGLVCMPGGSPLYGLFLIDCDDITVSNCVLRKSSGTQPYLFGHGMFVRRCDNVTVDGCEFKWSQYGLAHIDCNFLTITDCHFHDLGTDGIQGGGSNDVTISRNRFHSFYTPDTHHPDAIQFWTTNVTRLTERLTITDNLIYRGAGDVMQGIFIGDKTGYSWSAVTVEGNAVVGAMYHGIALSALSTGPKAIDVVYRDNFVLCYADQLSWMRAVNVANLTLGSNQYSYINNAGVTSTTYEGGGDGGNVKLTEATAVGDNTLLTAWLVTHPDVPAPV